MTIKLSKETRDRAIASIKRYFIENLDEEIGDLKASLLLDFCLQEIGPCIYNQAIADAQSYMVEAQSYMEDKISDLSGTCYEPEFNYWQE